MLSDEYREAVANKSETDIQGEIMIAASRMGARLLRNQVSLAFASNRHKVLRAGENYRATGGEALLFDHRKVSTGLGKGSPDLIGWTPITITPDMVGKTLAVFTGVEAKRPGQKPRPEQQKWIDLIIGQGGISGVATSPEDLEHILIK